MEKILLIIILTFATITFCNAQTIVVENALGGYRLTQDGKMMNFKDLKNATESNTDALEAIKSARVLNTLSTVFMTVGVGLTAYTLVNSSQNGASPAFLPTFVGFTLIRITIPISIVAKYKVKKAVELYNSGIKSTSLRKDKLQFNIISSGNGIGLSVSF